VRDDVHQQDRVEGTARLGQELGVGQVALQKDEVLARVPPPSDGDRRGRDIDADTARRVEGSQEIARAAPEIEDPLPFGDTRP
jgi:hypothetical protein